MSQLAKVKKVAAGVAALAALAAGGAAIAGATGGGAEENDGSDAPDQVVTGVQAQKAGKAAAREVGGGSVRSIERSDEDGNAYYEVKVVDEKGNVQEVQVDRGFNATGSKPDDDAQEAGDNVDDNGDGDGETADDQNGYEDDGDGDGETAD
jgi:hypothetical protein